MIARCSNTIYINPRHVVYAMPRDPDDGSTLHRLEIGIVGTSDTLILLYHHKADRDSDYGVLAAEGDAL